MKERPILFSAPMVRALLDGSKTQTRRIVKPPPEWTEPATVWLSGDGHSGPGWYAQNDDYPEEGSLFYRCPYGQPGDKLWVRETHAPQSDCWGAWERSMQYGSRQDSPIIHYAADKGDEPFIEKWRPSIHMPRWASRITLELFGVRVERLQDISEADALAEGITCENVIVEARYEGGCHHEITADRYFFDGGNDEGYDDAIEAYAQLWDFINGAGAWEKNPWVWVVEFRRLP